MRRAIRGSAMVETALSCLIASALLSGSLYIGKTALASRRSHALARHAAALKAAGVPLGLIDVEMSDYSARLGGGMVWTLGRYDRSAAARFYRLTEAVVTADVAVPPIAGGGSRRLTSRAVVEEDRP